MYICAQYVTQKCLRSISSEYLVGRRFIIWASKIRFTSAVIFDGRPDPPSSYATIFNKLAERLMHSYPATIQPLLFQILLLVGGGGGGV